MSPLALSLRFLQTQPDARLAELAHAGHERAFEALVQRYRTQLLRYCRRLAPSDAAAEDVLQQALLQAWVAIRDRNVEVRQARAWLYRIVHNVAISSLRCPQTSPLAARVGITALGADDEVEQRVAVRQALAGIAALPDLQRQVMVNAAFGGSSHEEIAAELGLSHGAVRGLMYRARAALRAAAAVFIPGPAIAWAARQGGTRAPAATGIMDAVAGGGSAGVAGVLIKGGALVATAGAIATAAGITASHPAHRGHVRSAAGQVRFAADPAARAGAASGRGVGAAAAGGSAGAAGSPAALSRAGAAGAHGPGGFAGRGGPRQVVGRSPGRASVPAGGSGSSGSHTGATAGSVPAGGAYGGSSGSGGGGSGGGMYGGSGSSGQYTYSGSGGEHGGSGSGGETYTSGGGGSSGSSGEGSSTSGGSTGSGDGSSSSSGEHGGSGGGGTTTTTSTYGK